MRTIQRLSVKSKKQHQSIHERFSIIEISLPENSKILAMEYYDQWSQYGIWFEGTTEDNCKFEKHKLGIFGLEDDMPSEAMRFHSRVESRYPHLFLYEFIIPTSDGKTPA